MSLLQALLFATPVFGFQLSAPALDVTVDAAAPPPMAALAVPTLALDVAVPLDAAATAPAAEDAAAAAERAYADAIRERNRVAKIHKILGISTWASMAATLTFGFIQYSNLYGFGGTHTDNPCVNGNAIGGYEACLGRPLPHTISSIVTSALYFTTLSLSWFMPDPDDAATGDSAFAKTLRLHKILRWVHLAGMISQIALGIVTANVFDRANPDDFKVAQALGTVHMGIGLVTFGALTWAGALMTF
jgi:hypothetical protein